ncbi:sodium-dependent phosphate transporter 1 [Planococcus citri]|uniref:sodium-dependent phosphate transporter 1 n=1 Tax=Planococcus citri TaxID=170843 RepID=UPI0031F857A3
MEAYSPDLVWLVVISFFVAFILSFGIGANDVANSFGTSVGAKVLTLKSACMLATVFEIAGAVLIGYKVSDTLRKVLVDVNMYQDSEKQLILGYLSSLGGSGAWLIIATAFRVPISGTHSIVGATIGFSLVAKGASGLKWSTLFGIVASWFISPICSGLVSVIVYVSIRRYILKSSNPVRNGLQALPIFYGVTIGINVFSVVEDGSKLLHLDKVPLWGSFTISIFFGVFSAIVVYLFVVPKQHIKLSCLPSITRVNTDDSAFHPETRTGEKGSIPNTPLKRSDDDFYILRKYDQNSHDKFEMTEITTTVSENQKQKVDGKHTDNNNTKKSKKEKEQIGLIPNASEVPLIKIESASSLNNGSKSPQIFQQDLEKDDGSLPRTPIENIFAFLQILTAIFGSFAHGGNDVSNAIGPLVAVWLIYSDGSVMQQSETPFFILLYGGIGISVGLCLWGRNVIKTVGEDLTRITPSTGFSIELGSSMTVLLASKLGVPISTTHCKVGSVVFVGWSSSSKEGVDWGLFKNIIFAWVITLPVSAVLSATFMYLLSIYLL